MTPPGLGAGLSTGFGSRTAEGETYTTNTEREKNVRCAISGSQTVVATNYYGFIDLSDTVNWPHDDTGAIHISFIALLVDKASTARGSTSVGIITRIDGASADVVWVASASFTQNDTASVEIAVNYSPSQLKCDVVAGKLRYIKTNNVSLGLTAINTGTPLAFGPGGATFTPAVGDAVVRVDTTTGGNLVYGLSTFYHGAPAGL